MLAAIVGATTDAVVVIDTDGRLVHWNPGASAMFGYSEEEVLGRDVHQLLVPPAKRGKAQAAYKRYVETGQGKLIGRTVEVEARHRDGRVLDVELSLSPMAAADDGHVVALIRDLSERRNREGEVRAARAHAERVFDVVGCLILIRESDCRVREINEFGARFLGYQRDALIGKDWVATCVPKDEWPIERACFSKVLEGNEDTCELRSLVQHRNGDERELLWTHRRLIAADGSIEGVISSGLDVTEERRMADALERSERGFHNLVHLNRTGILVVDQSHRVRYANAAAMQLLDAERATLIGTPFEAPQVHQTSEVSILLPDGSNGVAEVKASETEWEGAQAYLLMLHDITARKAAEERANYLALHDGLTSLPNRLLFRERLERALDRARRGDKRVALIILNLNRFRQVNDEFGYDVGDEVLRLFAERLVGAVRASDTVARLGADEFTLVIEDLQDDADLDVVIGKLQRLVADPISAGEGEWQVGLSAGVALFPDDGDGFEALMRRAGDAQSAAKRGGSGRFRYYTSATDLVDRGRIRLEGKLQGALERGELSLHYQPEVSVAGGRLVGLEALLRWENLELGSVIPDRFVPVLESTGMIHEVGAWVVDHVCEAIAKWQSEGLDLVPVAINLSPKQVADPQLHEVIADALARHNVASRLLALELTEAAVIDDLDAGTAAMRRLADVGVWLHLDDFGTGLSSLGMMRQLPFDAVKIDRSFIKDIAHDDEAALLAAGVINMGHSLKKTVIAEGVERAEQLEVLNRFGCDVAQGWLYGYPAPASRIEDLMRPAGPRRKKGAAQRRPGGL